MLGQKTERIDNAMKKNRKKLLLTLAVVLVISLITISSFASPPWESGEASGISIELIDLPEPIPHDSATESLGPSSTKQALVINGEVNYLLCTFDDPVAACENMKREVPDLLAFLQEGYNLSDFSYDTWREYSAKINIMDRLPGFDPELLSDQEVFFGRFRDIIENDDDNAEIIAYARQRSGLDLSVLASMLPFTDPLYQAHEGQGAPDSRATAQIFNKEKGTAYAIKYAVNANVDEYGEYTSRGDCTNFTSQILENGDIKQHDEWPDKTKGWWHQKDNFWNMHLSSNSWTLASSFAYFMGVSDVTTNFYRFASSLEKGYFIAYDEGGDNRYDHMAYVTQIGTYNTYDGKYYRDFKVANHSRNYLEWVSSSNNNWEKLENGECQFCIVRKQ